MCRLPVYERLRLDKALFVQESAEPDAAAPVEQTAKASYAGQQDQQPYVEPAEPVPHPVSLVQSALGSEGHVVAGGRAS